MKTFKKLFLFLLIVSAASCDVGDDEELNYGNGAYVAQFPFAEKTGFFLKDDAATYDYTMPIEIVGGNGLALNQDITVTFEVDQTTLAAPIPPATVGLPINTAVEGLNFDFVGSTTIVIPAGSTFASIPLKVYSGTLDDQNPPVLLLKLTTVTSNGVSIVTSGNKGSVELTLQGTCSSDLAGVYNASTMRLDNGAGPYTVAGEVIDEVSTGTYNTTTTANFKLATATQVTTGAFNAQTGPADGGYTFNEVCGRIAVENQFLMGGYFTGNLVKQSAAQYAASSVNTATDVITVQFSIVVAGADRNYKTTYTPVP